MNLTRILDELRAERDRIEKAVAVLGNIGSGSPSSGRGRRGPRAIAAGGRRKRRLTPEGRKRLSEMMKKRWAERRKKGKAA